MSPPGSLAFPQLRSASTGAPLSRIAAGLSDLLYGENLHAQD
jgi:hypothetical protein